MNGGSILNQTNIHQSWRLQTMACLL